MPIYFTMCCFILWNSQSTQYKLQNSGLVNFIPKSCLPIAQIKSVLFLLPKNGRESLELVSKMGFIKSMEQKFPFGTFRPEKHRTTFSEVQLSSVAHGYFLLWRHIKLCANGSNMTPNIVGSCCVRTAFAHSLAFDRIKTLLGPFARGFKLCQ